MAYKIVDIKAVFDSNGAIKSITETSREVEKLEKVAKKSSNGIAAGFLKAEMAMKALQGAFKLGAESMKEFAKQTGDNTLATMSSQIDKVQLQIGASLTKEVGKFTKYFQENEKFILKAVANIAEGFMGLKDVIVGVFTMVGNSIYIALESIGIVIVGAVEGWVKIFTGMVSMLPDSIIPAGWKEGLQNFSNSVSDVTASMRRDIIDTGATIGEGFKTTTSGLGRIAGAFQGKTEVTEGTVKTDTKVSGTPKAKTVEKALKEEEKVKETFARRALESEIKYAELSLKELEEYWDKVLNMDNQAKSFLEQNNTAYYNAALQELDATTAKKIALINKNYADEQEALKTAGKSTVDSVKNQQLDVDNINKDAQKAREDLFIRFVENNQAIIDNEEEKNEQLKQSDEELRNARLNFIGGYVDAAVSAQGMINDVVSKASSFQSMLIEKDVEKRKLAAKANILNKRDLQKEYDRIDADADKKRRKLQKAQMLGDIAMAIAGGAQATINGLKTQPFMPLGIIMGALAAATSTASVGIMVAQYSKMATGGVVKGDSATGDSQPTMLTPGEVVLNKTQQANTLMAIANGQNTRGITLNGGSTSVTINGNADEVMVNRALTQNRQQQMKDMKALIKDMQYAGLIRMQVA
ncbi:MAG: hypothetical protein EHM87_16120 [Burkholderiales bacterium]|nr:MAG: hypothetical protein EHM87_16120 [Burkholderiales bacterium]